MAQDRSSSVAQGSQKVRRVLFGVLCLKGGAQRSCPGRRDLGFFLSLSPIPQPNPP